MRLLKEAVGYESVKELIKDNPDLINQNKFDELYDKLLPSDCNQLTEILLKAKVDFLHNMTIIPRNCFAKIEGLFRVVIPSNIRAIRSRAFFACFDLQILDIEEGVTDISDHAFDSCKQLSSIIFPKSLKSIGSSAFPDYIDFISFSSPIPFDEVIHSISKRVGTIKYPFPIDWYQVYTSCSKSEFSKLKYAQVITDSETYKYEDILKIVESQKVNIPTLYRVANKWYKLVAYMTKTGLPKVGYVDTAHGSKYCPIFFRSEGEALSFINDYNKLNKSPVRNKSDVYVARLQQSDTNFSLIETECGQCLIQEWKSPLIDSKYVVKKNYF